MRILKTSKLHANSKVEWDSTSGTKEGKIKQIFGTHASVVDSFGLIYIVPIKTIRKKFNAL